MREPKLERNIRMYIGRSRGVSLTEVARYENVTKARAYQIITATEYQLATGNPMYWAELRAQSGTYARI